jgi:hypothetical protein
VTQIFLIFGGYLQDSLQKRLLPFLAIAAEMVKTFPQRSQIFVTRFFARDRSKHSEEQYFLLPFLDGLILKYLLQ